MERLSFGADVAFSPRDELLENVSIAPLTAPMALGAPFQAAVFRLGPGGGIARHPATVPQILAVLEGEAQVRGEDGAADTLAAGEAVFWRNGEEHEVTAPTGATVLIVEGDGLEPFRR